MAYKSIFPAGTVGDQNLNPAEYQWFVSQRAKAQQARDYGLANLNRQKSIQDLSNQYDLADTTRQFQQQRQKLPGSFIRRGLGHSGLYQYGLGDYNTQFAQAKQRLLQKSTQDNLQYTEQSGQLGDAYTQALADMQDQELAIRLAKAAQIGGY